MELSDKKGLKILIVARDGCSRCETIKVVAERDGATVEILRLEKGGAQVLARYNFIPMILPAMLIFDQAGKVLHRWCGVSQFLEKWTEGEE